MVRDKTAQSPPEDGHLVITTRLEMLIQWVGIWEYTLVTLVTPKGFTWFNILNKDQYSH